MDFGFGEGGVLRAHSDRLRRQARTDLRSSKRPVMATAHSRPVNWPSWHAISRAWIWHLSCRGQSCARQTSLCKRNRVRPEDVLSKTRLPFDLDPTTGAMTSLRFKRGDWEVLSGPGNVVAREQDRGDLWELYQGLDGGSRVAMTTRQNVPDVAKPSSVIEGKASRGTLPHGPVFSEFAVARPFDPGRFATTVRVYQGLAQD